MSLRDRYRFPDEEGAIEFRAFTHGLQPETVPERMAQFTEDWRRYGVDAWNQVPNHWRPQDDTAVGWWSLPTYLADEFVAPILNAPAGTCILQPNVHWTVQCLLSAEEIPGGEIVVSETAFPSVLHSAQQWADLRPFTPHVVPATADGQVDLEAVLDAIGPDTAFVSLSHVGFTTGRRLPDEALRTVADRAHAHDAFFLVDGYHAASTMPVDVQSIGCDAYVGGLLKEASGSSGNAFLYIRDDRELTPRLTGWFGDADPFGFQTSPEPHPEVRRRFLGGTTSVASMYHAVEGLRILLDAGLEAVRAHSLALTDRAIAHADAAGLALRSPRDPAERSAMLLVEAPDAHALCEYLKTKGVYTDSRRNEVLRLAPFVWNTQDEVDRAFDVLTDALSSGAHLAADLGDAVGPVT